MQLALVVFFCQLVRVCVQGMCVCQNQNGGRDQTSLEVYPEYRRQFERSCFAIERERITKVQFGSDTSLVGPDPF